MTTYGVGHGVQLWGWDSGTSAWVKILVNAAGKLIIDPSEIFEEPPTDGEMGKAPTSNWAHDHADLPDIHHVAFVAADHTAIGNGAPHHAEAHTLASHSTKAHSELSGVGSSDHHVRYADSEAIAAAKTDPALLNYTQGARVYHSVAQSIANNDTTPLAFDSETYDTDAIHDPSTNNGRLTCKTAGKYVISFTVYFSSGATATGVRRAYVRVNDTTTFIWLQKAGEATDEQISGSTIYPLAVNDYLELNVYQNSGGAMDIGGGAYTHFEMQRVG